VKIMPLVAPTDQLKLDRADLSVEARCDNIPKKEIYETLKNKNRLMKVPRISSLLT